jgi:hypothetical protein
LLDLSNQSFVALLGFGCNLAMFDQTIHGRVATAAVAGERSTVLEVRRLSRRSKFDDANFLFAGAYESGKIFRSRSNDTRRTAFADIDCLAGDMEMHAPAWFRKTLFGDVRQLSGQEPPRRVALANGAVSLRYRAATPTIGRWPNP